MWRMYYTIVRNLPRLPGILETMHRMTDRSDLFTEKDKYDYVRNVVVHLMQKTGHIRTEGFGMDQLPGEGGYVLYANHQGKFDAYSVIATHERPVTAVMDREKSYFVLINEIMDILQGKRMDITDARHGLKVIRAISEEVRAGRRYLIFPEGAYSDQKRHTLWDFKPGCFKAATKVKAPIVPVVLVDTYKPYNSWLLTPARTQVHYLQPIRYEEYQAMTTVQIAQLVRQRIQDKLTELGL